jgi:hypothetical protein
MAGTATSRALYLLAFAALLAAAVGMAAISSPAGAAKVRTLGKTKNTPQPDCPETATFPCNGIGKVTGFMLAADGKKHPFSVREKGKLIAWALDLSRPKKHERRFFGSIFGTKKFGGTPTARLAVLSRTGSKKYKLLRQSPIVKLSDVLGRKEIFTLHKPLRVRKGQVVALTYPTWAPNFATTHVGPASDQWRASRRHSRCNTQILRNAKRSRPQQKVGSIRPYRCDYKAARLLYWAYYVPA